MKIIADSHLDHGLSPEQIRFIQETFADRSAFFIETIELPAELGSIRCALHGPIVGEDPIDDNEARFVVRGKRPGPSRVCDRSFGSTRLVTVIAGPHENEPCVLFTAYGGPVAPREPWDPSLDEANRLESKAFWAEHALSIEPHEDNCADAKSA